MSALRNLFVRVEKPFDCLYAVRLIVYMAAGYFVIYPLAMTVAMLAHSATTAPAFFDTFSLPRSMPLWVLFVLAPIAGFALVNFACIVLVVPAYRRVKQRYGLPASMGCSWPFHRDTAASPVHERRLRRLVERKFCCVEVSLLVPLSLFIGLCLLALHALLYLLQFGSASGDIATAALFLAALSGLLAFLRGPMWNRFWRPKVYERHVYAYLLFKIIQVNSAADLAADGPVDAADDRRPHMGQRA